MSVFNDAGTFLIQSLASIYLVILMLRFMLQLSGADFYNPVSQFAHKATAPVLKPVRKLFPTLGKLDMACVVAALLVQWLAIQATISLHGYSLVNPLYILSWGMLGILNLTINFYTYGLLAVIILSWVAPQNQHPAVALLWQLMEPLMAPLRKVLPALGGIDLSPIFIFIGLNLLRIFVEAAAVAIRLPSQAVPGI
jgi:YggT family protein